MATPSDISAISSVYFGPRRSVRCPGKRCRFQKSAQDAGASRSRRLGEIRMSSGPDPAPDSEAIHQALLDGVREY